MAENSSLKRGRNPELCRDHDEGSTTVDVSPAKKRFDESDSSSDGLKPNLIFESQPRKDGLKNGNFDSNVNNDLANLEKVEAEKRTDCIVNETNESFDDDYDCDDDDFDDCDAADVPPEMEDFLDDFEDDESIVSVSTSISTCSSISSLANENIECLSDSEGKTSVVQRQFLGGAIERTGVIPLRKSLFPHVPPFINFVNYNEMPLTPLPDEITSQLKWKLSNITPALVKRIVSNTGFRLMRKNTIEWTGTWGKHSKSHIFKELHSAQKFNHMPGTFNIGRKDRLWKNFNSMRKKYKDEYSFLPRTFCLPTDTKLLKKVWEKQGCRAKWIVKPPALARGSGITVVNKWSQIPKTRPLVVQKYLARPHLINGTKYDLRIYVLLTSVNPLTIYLFDEGLARFASKSYTTENSSLSDVFCHLTNYSVNRNNVAYLHNEDSGSRQGHKWTLSQLWSYLWEQGIDTKQIHERIKDLVIKTIISCEHIVYPTSQTHMDSHYKSYELFGMDVLLDEKMKPWLIEVNISPSLHSSSPLDLDVKSPLTTEVFNLAKFHIPPVNLPDNIKQQVAQMIDSEDTENICLDQRLYSKEISRADRLKHIKFADSPRSEYLEAILENLTPSDVRTLIRMEDEYSQTKRFSRIFPTQESHTYLKLLTKSRYSNLLTDAWETKYGSCREIGIARLTDLCQKKFHLRVPTNSKAKSSNVFDVSMLKAPTGEVSESSCKPCVEEDKVNGAERAQV